MPRNSVNSLSRATSFLVSPALIDKQSVQVFQPDGHNISGDFFRFNFRKAQLTHAFTRHISGSEKGDGILLHNFDG